MLKGGEDSNMNISEQTLNVKFQSFDTRTVQPHLSGYQLSIYLH